jgi:hypothetical protein
VYLLFVHQVDVRMREGNVINIHMFCPRKPGILLSTMRALESLGLDIEQAVTSCFGGFAMDIFRAEVCGGHIVIISSSIIFDQILSCIHYVIQNRCVNGPGPVPEVIKAMLVHSADLHDALL